MINFSICTILVTGYLQVALDVVSAIGDTKITSAGENKMKGADLIWSNLTNN